jgi:hypothetical protein
MFIKNFPSRSNPKQTTNFENLERGKTINKKGKHLGETQKWIPKGT